MKLGVFLFLAAGPLAVWGQKRPGDLFGWQPPKVELRAFALPAIKPALSIRVLLPDRMACLTAPGADAMPTDRRKGRDPMPNGVKRLKK